MGGRRAKSHLQIINDYYCYRDKEDWQRGRGDCCILYLPRGHCGKVLQLIKSLEAVLRLKQRCEEDSAGGKVAKIGETSCGFLRTGKCCWNSTFLLYLFPFAMNSLDVQHLLLLLLFCQSE